MTRLLSVSHSSANSYLLGDVASACRHISDVACFKGVFCLLHSDSQTTQLVNNGVPLYRYYLAT